MGYSPEDIAELKRRTSQGPSEVSDKGLRPRRAALTRKEQDIQTAILEAARFWKGVTLWKTGGGLLPLADGRRVRMGVVGVSDLIGWKTEKVITSWSDGYEYEPHARFVAIEVKREGRYPTREQFAFLEAVKEAGGIAIVARNVEDARKVLSP